MVSSYKVDAYLLTPYFAKQFFGGSFYSVNSCEADVYVFWKHSAITEASEWRWRDSNS